MEAFNIAVGVSNIVNCVTGICTLGAYRKNEPCKLTTHLEESKKHLSTAYKDLANFSHVLGADVYQELDKDCKKLSDDLKTNVAAVKIANAKYFVRRKKYGELLDKTRTLEEEIYDAILKIRGQSAAAIQAERQRTTRRKDAQTVQSVNDQEQDSNQRNPFSDEVTVAWQGHEHNA